MSGEIPVNLSAYLPHNGKLKRVEGQYYAHCMECVKAVEEENLRYENRETHILDRDTGILVGKF